MPLPVSPSPTTLSSRRVCRAVLAVGSRLFQPTSHGGQPDSSSGNSAPVAGLGRETTPCGDRRARGPVHRSDIAVTRLVALPVPVAGCMPAPVVRQGRPRRRSPEWRVSCDRIARPQRSSARHGSLPIGPEGRLGPEPGMSRLEVRTMLQRESARRDAHPVGGSEATVSLRCRTFRLRYLDPDLLGSRLCVERKEGF